MPAQLDRVTVVDRRHRARRDRPDLSADADDRLDVLRGDRLCAEALQLSVGLERVLVVVPRPKRPRQLDGRLERANQVPDRRRPGRNFFRPRDAVHECCDAFDGRRRLGRGGAVSPGLQDVHEHRTTGDDVGSERREGIEREGGDQPSTVALVVHARQPPGNRAAVGSCGRLRNVEVRSQHHPVAMGDDGCGCTPHLLSHGERLACEPPHRVRFGERSGSREYGNSLDANGVGKVAHVVHRRRVNVLTDRTVELQEL